MEAKAIARHVRIAPRKVRQVADEIKAKALMRRRRFYNSTRSAAEVLSKVLNSAVANAENNFDLDRSSFSGY